MTSRPLTLRPWQIAALQQSRLRMVVLPLRPQPHPGLPIGGAEFVQIGDDDPGSWCWLNGFDGSIISKFLVPFSPGDTLWVRETWAPKLYGDWPYIDYRTDSGGDEYLGNAKQITMNQFDAVDRPHNRWRSPVTMPRWASRYTLTAGPQTVKRLQEVTEEEAIWTGTNGGCRNCGEDSPCRCPHPKPDFIDGFIYDICADHGRGSWDANPVCLFAQVEEKNDGHRLAE